MDMLSFFLTFIIIERGGDWNPPPSNYKSEINEPQCKYKYG